LLSLLGTAQAADFSPSVIIDRVKNSLVRVETKRESPFLPIIVTGQGGTGFVVSTDENETIIATAKHVVDDKAATFFSVIFEDVGYNTTEVHMIVGTDAAYLIVRPGIKGTKALNFNLSFDDSVVDALAFGHAMSIRIRNENQKPTFTVGKLCRKVSQKIAYGGDCETAIGIIYGTPTLLQGYSGGPCVDLDYNLLGINVAISRHMIVVFFGITFQNLIKRSLPMFRLISVFTYQIGRVNQELL
jgi:S1-C subfamily serine protease